MPLHLRRPPTAHCQPLPWASAPQTSMRTISCAAQRPPISYLHPLAPRRNGAHKNQYHPLVRQSRFVCPGNSERRHTRQSRRHWQLPQYHQLPAEERCRSGPRQPGELTGTVHKLHLPLPVELLSTVSATADGRIHLHVDKINVEKIPLKGLLGALHVEIDDIVGASPMTGVEVSDNDIFLTTTQMLPPPHIRGLLSSDSPSLPQTSS